MTRQTVERGVLCMITGIHLLLLPCQSKHIPPARAELPPIRMPGLSPLDHRHIHLLGRYNVALSADEPVGKPHDSWWPVLAARCPCRPPPAPELDATRAKQWCADAAALAGVEWSYRKMPQKGFGRSSTRSPADLLSVLDAWAALVA